jgi:hypothetical protein
LTVLIPGRLPFATGQGTRLIGALRRLLIVALHTLPTDPEVMMSRFPTRGVVAGLAVALYGCASQTSTSEVAGECQEAFGADVCTWATMEGDAVVEVGATIPLASIEGAPADAPFTWPPTMGAAVNMPETSFQQNGVSHLTMLWESMGHPPATFAVPHFDFHFYLISPDERNAIDCSQLSKPSELPEGYGMPDEQLPPDLVEITGVETLIGLCVPEMGMHSLVAVEMESPDPFDGTMVVGYYEGAPIFLEPMISRSFLLERRSFDLTVPAVPGLEGEQPTMFRADYDAEQDAYRFTFSEFSRDG